MFLLCLNAIAVFLFIEIIYCAAAHLSPLFLRSGCLKDMESTEKSRARKTFSARSKKARMSSATFTEIPLSGESIAHISIKTLSDRWSIEKLHLVPNK